MHTLHLFRKTSRLNLLLTKLHLYSLFSRYLSFPRLEASKGSLGNWQVYVNSNNAGQFCNTSESTVWLTEYRWGCQTLFVWVPDLGITSTPAITYLSCYILLLITKPTGPQSRNTPCLWAWAPTGPSSTKPTHDPPRHSLISWPAVTVVFQGELCNPTAGDLWSRL